jgi:hypothetical protein
MKIKAGYLNPYKADLKEAQLVLVFGSPLHMQNKSLFDEIRQSYPQAYILEG